jgi:hypothetical protein
MSHKCATAIERDNIANAFLNAMECMSPRLRGSSIVFVQTGLRDPNQFCPLSSKTLPKEFALARAVRYRDPRFTQE